MAGGRDDCESAFGIPPFSTDGIRAQYKSLAYEIMG
jgi:hypothetical protein